MKLIGRITLSFLRISLFILVALLTLGAANAIADPVSCADNQDCQKGEVCVGHGNAPQGTCVKRCDPLQMNLITNGTESYTTSDGNYIRYSIKVTNWFQYAEEMFAPAPDLPACGLNTNSSRSWVDIYNAETNARIYGFCGLEDAEGLTEIWFGVKQGDAPPGKVTVTMEDRKTGRKYCSNVVAIGNGN